MDEFKYIANGAWKGMMELPNPEPVVRAKKEAKMKLSMDTIFGRNKRGAVCCKWVRDTSPPTL